MFACLLGFLGEKEEFEVCLPFFNVHSWSVVYMLAIVEWHMRIRKSDICVPKPLHTKDINIYGIHAKDKNMVVYVKNKEYDQLSWLKFRLWCCACRA